MTKFTAAEIELEELAAFLLGKELGKFADKDGEYEYNLWSAFYDEFLIEERYFARLVNKLVPLIDLGKSPLTGQVYKGFSDAEARSWLVKMKVSE